MFENILWVIILLISGGCIGALIAVKYLEKSVDELMASYNNLVKTQDDIMKLDDKIIKESKKLIMLKNKLIVLYESVIGKAYNDLVSFRENGGGDLDEVIGLLGEALDDHKEESECNSDQ